MNYFPSDNGIDLNFNNNYELVSEKVCKFAT